MHENEPVGRTAKCCPAVSVFGRIRGPPKSCGNHKRNFIEEVRMMKKFYNYTVIRMACVLLTMAVAPVFIRSASGKSRGKEDRQR